jgi:hypothetical protein
MPQLALDSKQNVAQVLAQDGYIPARPFGGLSNKDKTMVLDILDELLDAAHPWFFVVFPQQSARFGECVPCNELANPVMPSPAISRLFPQISSKSPANIVHVNTMPDSSPMRRALEEAIHGAVLDALGETGRDCRLSATAKARRAIVERAANRYSRIPTSRPQWPLSASAWASRAVPCAGPSACAAAWLATSRHAEASGASRASRRWRVLFPRFGKTASFSGA